jgi:hypothetical protein
MFGFRIPPVWADSDGLTLALGLSFRTPEYLLELQKTADLPQFLGKCLKSI